jgi:pyridoxamine 5'-phosphate oxidase
MDDAPFDPMKWFDAWFADARREEPLDPTAMALATVDADGRPSVRMVLLKGADDRGFFFFTNYESRKARALDATKRAALCIHWPTIARQVRVEGSAARVEPAESDAYFATRPRGSQIGAWASDQSRDLQSRQELLDRVAKEEARWAGREVERPPHWGGFVLVPDRIEMWQGRESRLHERFVFERAEVGWRRRTLYP